MTYDEIVDYLYNIPRFTKGGHMINCKKLLNALDDPQDSFKYIHVAGTNGKGSVCAYLERCLRLCHKKTGLFTSPHLVRVNERMRICGREISNEDFVRIFNEIQALVCEQENKGCVTPTFFEYIYLMAMVYFREQQIEYGIIETGLGGRMDFTNCVQQPVLTILTPISMDHMQVLGDTIEKIADEKAGIIKQGSPLVYYGQDPAVKSIIQGYVDRFGIISDRLMNQEVQIESDDGKTIDFSLDCGYHGKCSLSLNTAATYQAVNASLALKGFKMLYPQMSVNRPFMDIATEALITARWPGRMEELTKRFFVDGAHNEAGIDAFVSSIESGFCGKPLSLVFAVAGDKDYKAMIRKVCTIKNLKGVVVTEIENGRRCDLKEVIAVFEKNWNGIVRGTYNIREAISFGMDMRGEDGILCCVGSLYLVGSIKKIMGKSSSFGAADQSTGGDFDDQL